ncbi:hypothetical protein B6U98_01870 [Thermoplasmatales archaeon ex4572_165]|nr:MAG: hypothetical protein B6U98_01870 [Thermoplasmatales archaeon ex4572_165]
MTNKNKSIFALFSIFLFISVCWVPAITGHNDIPTYKSRSDQNTNIFKDNKTEYYAVIAACSEYENRRNNIPKFPFPSISEKKLTLLYSSLLLSSNWKEENIILLINEDATYDNITKALDEMSTKVTENDIFLFQWQGHGSEVPDNDNDEYDGTDEIICPYDLNMNQSIYLTDDNLNYYFSNINSKAQIIIVESCLSGGLVNGQNDIDKENRIIILSTFENTLGRALYLTGFPLNFALAVSSNQQLSNIIKDENNTNNFISIQECFKTAEYLAYGQYSIFWIFLFIQCFSDTKSVSDAVISMIYSFCLIESVSFLISGHIMLNHPQIIDNYGVELPFIKI